MKVHVDRSSVHVSDDFESHACVVEVPATDSLEALVRSVLQAYPLPSIAGGKATWCVSVDYPVAVIAQEWRQPYFLPTLQVLSTRTPVGDGVEMCFSYLDQIDPDSVVSILTRIRFGSRR